MNQDLDVERTAHEKGKQREKGSRRRVVASLLMLLMLVGLCVELLSRSPHEFNPLQFVRRPGNVQTRDDAALLSGWLDQVDNSWEVGKNHQLVRSAFKRVVADARQATVRVMLNGRQVALGTIVDSDGFVLTKASEVVGESARISCQLANHTSCRAELIGVLASHDLAMLRIAKSDLPTVEWVQDEVPAVGSLLATPHHGKEPLAIGVVSLAPQKVDNNSVLGIRLGDAAKGPFVRDIVPRSAADLAGMREGDVVLRIDSDVVGDSVELVDVISKRLPGDDVEILVNREGEEMTLTATLGRREELDQDNVNFQSFVGGKLSFRRSGFTRVLQHDTFLLPEHCGGPLVDLDGKVVGVNIARAERIASYALPAATVLPWLDDLKSGMLDDSQVVRRSLPSSESVTESRQTLLQN